MELVLVYARSRNGVIGRDNQLPWRLPEDMAHFKAMTLGCPVIMGRRTWDSIPPKFRPLPGRRNVVITRQPDWQGEGAERVASLHEALALCAGSPRVCVTGGSEIFRLALPHADVIEMTVIEQDYEGDVHAPELGPEWVDVARTSAVSASGIPYSFVTLRKSAVPR